MGWGGAADAEHRGGGDGAGGDLERDRARGERAARGSDGGIDDGGHGRVGRSGGVGGGGGGVGAGGEDEGGGAGEAAWAACIGVWPACNPAGGDTARRCPSRRCSACIGPQGLTPVRERLEPSATGPDPWGWDGGGASPRGPDPWGEMVEDHLREGLTPGGGWWSALGGEGVGAVGGWYSTFSPSPSTHAHLHRPGWPTRVSGWPTRPRSRIPSPFVCQRLARSSLCSGSCGAASEPAA